MKKLLLVVFGLYGIIMPLQLQAEGTAKWLDFSQQINPVARPLDKLMLCVHGCIASKYLTWNITQQPDQKYGKIAEWVVQSNDGKKGGQASIRTGFLEEILPTPIGIRYIVYISKPEVITLSAYMGFSRRKGFYRAKLMGKRSVTVAPGWQNLDIKWSDLGISQRNFQKVNGFGLTSHRAPFKMKIARIELIFNNNKQAKKYKQSKDLKLAKLQHTMLDCLAARGIKINSTQQTTEQIEQAIWEGIQLAAIKEQLDIWSRLAKYNKLDHMQVKTLLNNQKQLKKQLEQGNLSITEKISTLQKHTDSFIDSIRKRLPVIQRQWTYGKDRRFYRPDGTPYRMFGPFFFRSLYTPPRFALLWRPWDLRYLSGLGFNGIRIVIKWNGLEPEQGKFNQVYLKMLKDIMLEAERYGFGISIDLHWPYPQWFVKGNPKEKPTSKLDKNNSYHWPDALQNSWGRLAAELKDIPNIVAFEVPTNETPIASNPKGVMASPTLMRLWNQWLKATYKTRENLQECWSAAITGSKRYSLASDENWNNNSIRPLGFQSDQSVDNAYSDNPRLQDHLRWVAWMQMMQTDGIMKQIRKSIPHAKGMMQRTIGDMWDHSPVPLNYRSIQTYVADNVLAGTHYGMGSIQARKAAALSLGSYDSEQQMENNSSAVKRQVKLGLGFCPFAFHYRGGGGMLLADDSWHLKPQVAHLSKNSKWIRTFWPPPKHGIKVAVIVNSRLEATTGRVIDKLIIMLENTGCDVKVFESMRVIKQPNLLKKCRLAISSSNYIDPRLIHILKYKYRGIVLINGRLDIDAYARRQSAGLPALLANEKIFLRKPEVKTFAEASGNIDLSGSWAWCFVGPKSKAPTKVPSNLKWEKMMVPGMWGEMGITGSLQYRIGDGWYRKEINIPTSWKKRRLCLKLGGVDDIDWVFFNGKLIGKTGTSTQNYWMIKREYSIPDNLIRWGKENELYVCVRNLRGDGGLWKKPVSISGNSKNMVHWTGRNTETPLECSSTTTMLNKNDLLPSVKILGTVKIARKSNIVPALIKQGRWYWWLGGNSWNDKSPADTKVITTILKQLD